MPDWGPLLARTARYYASKARAHGATPPGVDWNSAESQRTRFDQFARLIDGAGPFSINDYGCGYGALVDWLEQRGAPYRYHGVDLAPEMIALARARHGRSAACRFSESVAELAAADYTVASGIFNVKLGTPAAEWERYVFDTIDALAALSLRGFAFNMLTLDSDPARRRADLFYADPAEVFTRCRTRYARAAAVLQDYGLYEFTIIVRKDGVPA